MEQDCQKSLSQRGFPPAKTGPATSAPQGPAAGSGSADVEPVFNAIGIVNEMLSIFPPEGSRDALATLGYAELATRFFSTVVFIDVLGFYKYT